MSRVQRKMEYCLLAAILNGYPTEEANFFINLFNYMGRSDLLTAFHSEMHKYPNGIIPWYFLENEANIYFDDDYFHNWRRQMFSSRYRSVLRWLMNKETYKVFTINKLHDLYILVDAVIEDRKSRIQEHLGERRNKAHIEVKNEWRMIKSTINRVIKSRELRYY